MNKILFFILFFWGCTSENIVEKKFNVVTIDEGTFDIPVYVVITNDKERALKFVKDYNDTSAKIEDFDARGVTFTINDGRPPIIWLPKMSTSPEDMSIASHELLHANFSILNWAGVYLSDSTEEVFTYNYQFLIKKFYEKYDK